MVHSLAKRRDLMPIGLATRSSARNAKRLREERGPDEALPSSKRRARTPERSRSSSRPHGINKPIRPKSKPMPKRKEVVNPKAQRSTSRPRNTSSVPKIVLLKRGGQPLKLQDESASSQRSGSRSPPKLASSCRFRDIRIYPEDSSKITPISPSPKRSGKRSMKAKYCVSLSSTSSSSPES